MEAPVALSRTPVKASGELLLFTCKLLLRPSVSSRLSLWLTECSAVQHVLLGGLPRPGRMVVKSHRLRRNAGRCERTAGGAQRGAAHAVAPITPAIVRRADGAHADEGAAQPRVVVDFSASQHPAAVSAVGVHAIAAPGLVAGKRSLDCGSITTRARALVCLKDDRHCKATSPTARRPAILLPASPESVNLSSYSPKPGDGARVQARWERAAHGQVSQRVHGAQLCGNRPRENVVA
jgi:hypothetical protein